MKKRRAKGNSGILMALGIAAGVAAVRLVSRERLDVRGKTVLITGGSRGLGLLIAREFAKSGAKVAITARDSDELGRAVRDLKRFAGDILAVESDVTLREEADAAVEKVRGVFGPVDVLVNNAGIICVGPMEVMTIDDYRDSINTHFWGPYFTTMAVLEDMQNRKRGRIVNISSIGGKLSVPHLLPYCVGKFALTGFSEGLRSALIKDGVFVTTVCPGLLRTGSPRNAKFRGDNEAEYAWFSTSDALPGLSMDADRAARRIVEACLRGEAEVVLSAPAKFAVTLNALVPGLTAEALALANSLLPAASRSDTRVKSGRQSSSRGIPSWARALNEQAAAANNEMA